MYKETMTYTDFNGTERTEDFYFNLTEAEVTEMQLSTNGGLDAYIKNIVAAQNTAEIIALFKDLICKSYGQKSLDGRGFYKDDAILREFKSTQAFSDLYMKLATDTEAATAFVNGITPNVKEPEDHKKKVTKSSDN